MRLRPVGGDRWQATGGDPQFLFPPPATAPATLALFLDSRPGIVRPRLYLDWSDGFHEYNSADVGEAQVFLIRLQMADVRGLRQIRFDPVEDPTSFRFRFALEAGSSPALDDWRRELEAARADGAVVNLFDGDALDYAPAAEGRPIGLKRRPRKPHEQFLRIVEVARRELIGEVADVAAASEPLISFVTPVHNTAASYLDDLLESFRAQIPGACELVLSDDGSSSEETDAWLKSHEGEPGLVILRRSVNKGIAITSNEGIRASRGKWVGFVDHDDALAPHAVAAIARVIRRHPECKFIYTDELIVDAKMRGVDFFHKPAFDDVLLSGVNYINHLSLYRRDLLDEIAGFREGYDGSQDYDLLLRYLARLRPSEILHLPYPAYLWRRDGGSYSIKFLAKATANARRALGEAYAAEVDEAFGGDLHRVRLDGNTAATPKISIVIPNKDSFALISRLIDGLLHKTDYPDFEILVIDNGTTDPDVLAFYEKTAAESPRFKLHLETAKFNFSRQVNIGLKQAAGELILLLNNDIEVIEPGWLKEMAGCFRYPGTGIVGARLLYPNQTLQHAGVIVGLGGLAGHWFNHRPADFAGPMGRLRVRSGMTAVTGACMMISRECLDRVGLFDEETFAVAYNDVDYCLRAREAGLRVIYTPFATLVHYESATRGRDDRGPNRARFLRDQAALLERHGTEDFQDPFYSPWYDRDGSEPNRMTLDELPDAR